MRQSEARPLREWFELPGWEPMAPVLAPATAERLGPCLVLGDGALSDALTARLREMGCPVVRATSGSGFAARADGLTVDPGSADDHVRLLEWSARCAQAPRRILVAWAAGSPDPDQRVDATLERALYPLIALGRAVARNGDRSPLAIDVLTTGACDVDGAERVDPALTTVLGPVRVLPLELPHVSVRHIDLGADAASGSASADGCASLADRVLRELPAAQPAIVALRGRVRWQPTLRPVDLSAEPGERAWRPHGSYLITGGAGALGLALAEHLARTVQARLTLVMRTPPGPGTPEAAAIERIEAAGAVVSVHAADVADPAAMRRVRDEVLRRFGRLDGLVHAAGVSGGGLVETRERADVERVLSPKVRGTLVLADVFGQIPLDVLVLCSSLTSFVGGVGQVDYCAANAFLDAFPSSGQPLADRALALNWGGLLGSRMWVPREGDVGMELTDAVDALGRAVGAGLRPRVTIAPVRVRDARPWVPGAGQVAGVSDPGDPTLRSTAELEQRLAALWAEALELDQVPVHASFFELGGNSLLAVELLWRLADELGFRLPMQLLVEAATPAAMARAIVARLNDQMAAR